MSYEVENPPENAEREEFQRYIVAELRRVSNAFSTIGNLRLKELHVAPNKPRNGDVILADGADFDPGSGAGFYGRSAGAWVLLG